MKTNRRIILFLLAFFLLSCGSKQESDTKHAPGSAHAEQKVFTCPMHPEIIKDKPGKCPICGMDLVEKMVDGEKENNRELEFLLKPTNTYVVSQVTTVKPTAREMPVTIYATGYIAYDTRQINTVSARVSGRIEKLYAKYRYQPVEKGQKLVDLYSKDLETAQQNFLFLLNNDEENSSLIKASEQKLLLLGLTQEQINQIRNSGKTIYSVSIYSPYSGHLHDITSSANTANNSNGMESGNMAAGSSTQELQLREGMYVAKGQGIFNIYNTRKLWAVINLYPGTQNTVTIGQKVRIEIDGLKDKEIEASINFIEPIIRNDEKNITARIYLDNQSNDIKIGAIVKAKLDSKKGTGLFVPASAIVSLGMSDVVFVKRGDLFETRKVQIGTHSDNWTEIISGVTKDDIIAENGQLLMDSESFIKTENK